MVEGLTMVSFEFLFEESKKVESALGPGDIKIEYSF